MNTKPSVMEGKWYTVVGDWTEHGEDIDIKQQCINNVDQAHYAIYISGKRQRPTYFGEMAHWDVARAYNDRVHWSRMITGDSI